MLRQLGALALGVFVFYAVITALSRLLVMREIPEYIETTTSAISNLYSGAFAK